MAKQIAHKIELHVDEQGGTSFQKLSGLMKVEDPSEGRDAIEMTDFDDDIEIGWPAPISKLGDLKVSLFWDEADTDQQRLRTLAREPQPNANSFPAFEIRLTTLGRKTTMKGWVKELASTTYEIKGKIMKDAMIHVTELPVHGVIV